MLNISNNSDEHFRFGGWGARLARARAAAARAAAARAAAARAAGSGGKGPLKIGQITYKVSSSHDNGRNRHFTPQINSPQGWSAGANNTGQYINMTFPKQFVKNVLTQGRINGAHGQYVKDFDLYYKNSSNRWVKIGRKRAGTNNGIVKAPVNKLTHEIQLNIKSWSRHITMRAGVEFGKAVSKTAEYTQSSAKLSSVPNVDTNVSEIKLSGTDKSVGKTSDLKSPDMNMNPDLKDDTKFELFINGKEINNNSNLLLVILVSLFLIGICNLK